jgi:hypothetical protein
LSYFILYYITSILGSTKIVVDGFAKQIFALTIPETVGLILKVIFCFVPTPEPSHVDNESVVSAAGVVKGKALELSKVAIAD